MSMEIEVLDNKKIFTQHRTIESKYETNQKQILLMNNWSIDDYINIKFIYVDSCIKVMIRITVVNSLH